MLALAAAAARAGYLGILRAAALRRDASSQQVSIETVPAQRGEITDRDGSALAISVPAYNIIADPFLIHEPDAAAAKLAPLLGSSQPKVAEALSQQTGFLYLAQGLEANKAKQVLALGLPGVEAKLAMKRVHPRGTLAGQVLGALSAEGQGLSGVELGFNSVLAGVGGQRRIVRDGLGSPIAISTLRQEQPGRSIALTIDANIQQRTEEVLAADASVFHLHRAAAIVLEAQSGAVLAAASWPPVNLEDQASLSPEALADLPVSFNYEPGSTFKVVAMGGALQEGLITPQSVFEVPEAIEMGGHVIHDAEAHPTEMLTASQILARSSNVGEIKIASLLGAQHFYEWAHRYGFGSAPGVGLPGEEAGVMPEPSSYSGSSMGNLPFGQGEMVTPMQLAAAYEAIADGGILRAPHIIARIGQRAVAPAPGRRILSESAAAQLRQMLKGPLQPGGTAAEVTVPGYQVAGKTGTAEVISSRTGEYSKSRFVASFIGFAPVSTPKVLAVVVSDEPTSGSIYGGQVDAPAWGEILSFALPYLGVAPEGGS
ncbi:MAG TPA: penicillin-binding protein 2 [Solirubrobacteraceae bacterium]|nr:penicillin-binding protein 2 [Solirubrobacteraceae bacterium]